MIIITSTKTIVHGPCTSWKEVAQEEVEGVGRAFGHSVDSVSSTWCLGTWLVIRQRISGSRSVTIRVWLISHKTKRTSFKTNAWRAGKIPPWQRFPRRNYLCDWLQWPPQWWWELPSSMLWLPMGQAVEGGGWGGVDFAAVFPELRTVYHLIWLIASAWQLKVVAVWWTPSHNPLMRKQKKWLPLRQVSSVW